MVDAVTLPGHAQSSGTWYGVIDSPFLITAGPERSLFKRLLAKTFKVVYAGETSEELAETHIYLGRNGNAFTMRIVFVLQPFNVGFDGIVDGNGVFSVLDGPNFGNNCDPKF